MANIPHNQESGEIKNWHERSEEEKFQSINSYSKMIIATTIKQQKQFWKESRSKEEIDKAMPYNPKTGEPYLGVNSVILQAAARLNGYETNEFMSMRQANTMGGRLKPLLDENNQQVISEKTGKPQYVQGVKIAVMHNYVLTPKLDDNNQPIMRQGADGKEVPVLVRKALDQPKMEVITLYHSSQFDNLDRSQFKEKNMENVENWRHEFRNTEREPRFERHLQSIGLDTKTTTALREYINAQNKGLDYKAPEFVKDKTQTQEQEQTQTQEKPKAKEKKGMER